MLIGLFFKKKPASKKFLQFVCFFLGGVSRWRFLPKKISSLKTPGAQADLMRWFPEPSESMAVGSWRIWCSQHRGEFGVNGKICKGGVYSKKVCCTIYIYIDTPASTPCFFFFLFFGCSCFHWKNGEFCLVYNCYGFTAWRPGYQWQMPSRVITKMTQCKWIRWWWGTYTCKMHVHEWFKVKAYQLLCQAKHKLMSSNADLDVSCWHAIAGLHGCPPCCMRIQWKGALNFWCSQWKRLQGLL